ncbi:MAG: hypothetical protein ACRD3K_01970, partial [Edaphobacter sp.]
MAGAWEARGLSAENKSLHATGRDTEANRQKREAFLRQLGQIAPEGLIYLDESSVSTQMTRTCARAPRGERSTMPCPAGTGKCST